MQNAPPTTWAILWAISAGMVFSVLNATMRALTQQMHPFQTQFLRYGAGFIVMIPLILRQGISVYKPNGIAGQLWRGVVHTVGLMLWFAALPHMALADMTAMGFTTPIFIMIGAALFFGEKMMAARWVAAGIGFAGVLVVLGPHLRGDGGVYALLMLMASPVFAGSFLITKALTRRDSPAVIVVWQSITVALFSAPPALYYWQSPTTAQWAWILLCGVLGSFGHYCLTRSFAAADISATQSTKFLDLVWATVLGIIVFGDRPSMETLAGGAVILASTLWIARREARMGAKARQARA